MKYLSYCFGALLCVSAAQRGAFSSETPIELWPQGAPGEKGTIGEERDTTKSTDNMVAGKRVMRIGNVAKPTMTVFRPPAGKQNGTAVIICPGGAYNILAWDLEGTEVCEWLNSIGVTGILLKYRVPKREGLEKQASALQDAQRAMGLARQRAKEWAIATDRIGVLGFSAGGHLAAALCSNTSTRSYPPVDEADTLSSRPDFALLIYPAYLTLKDDGDKISPEIKVGSNSPPAFLAMSENDGVRVENAVFYFLALKQAGVPAELHAYPTGGHGYGLRRTEHFVTTWPDRAADWLRSRRLLGAK